MLVGNQLFLKYEIEIKLSLMMADYVFSQTSKFLQFEDWVSLVGTTTSPPIYCCKYSLVPSHEDHLQTLTYSS